MRRLIAHGNQPVADFEDVTGAVVDRRAAAFRLGPTALLVAIVQH
jgi:hypothetical protein